MVGMDVYLGMIPVLRADGKVVRDFRYFPHPWGEWVLSNQANPVQSIKAARIRQMVSVMPPNNLIYYKSQKETMYGLIKAIYVFPCINNPPITGIWIQPISKRHWCPRYPSNHPGYYFQLLGSVFGETIFKTILHDSAI
ncbi:hypothetical protein O181_120218 [Austropuccinia psidii MF-1]|uniref:Uncharacterized protein n=1 Tax=Austropuccinia psidii MF-1 TaxID=1389203 RepID=A0A9Q3Q045_9BASI|nr:hypothetical protein [Austropuccinia psidii MF-1]